MTYNITMPDSLFKETTLITEITKDGDNLIIHAEPIANEEIFTENGIRKPWYNILEFGFHGKPERLTIFEKIHHLYQADVLMHKIGAERGYSLSPTAVRHIAFVINYGFQGYGREL